MDRLNEGQQALALEAMGRAGLISKRYARIFPEYEQDVESAANYGVVCAASTFIPGKGLWEYWSSRCIRGEIIDGLTNAYRQRKQERWVGWLDEMICNDESRAEASSPAFPDVIERLPAKHRAVCVLMYEGEGMSAATAGVTLGYSTNHGRKLHHEAMSILRHAIAA